MRVIKMIEGKLSEGLIMNTVEIKDFINSNTKRGICSNALGNILAKNSQFVKHGEERVKSICGGSYEVIRWGCKNE